MTNRRPRTFVCITPKLYTRLFSHVDAELRQRVDVTFQDRETNLTSAELAEVIEPYEVVISGWGTPAFDEAVLSRARRLRLVAHSAGSVKHLLPVEAFRRGIAVTHAAAAIAPAVADMSLLLVMALLRRLPQFDRAMRAGRPWEDAQAVGYGDEIAGTRIGVVGAGYTGRCFIRMLRALQAEVWVADPYLSPERAAELGVRACRLDELLGSCPVVSLQAPSTPETFKMIGRRELSLLQDGAGLVNTARSWLVDETALLAELRSGRINAALDVFDEEPLPVDSPFRQLPNVILLPHVAGGSSQTARRQGRLIADELARFVAGEPLRYAVCLDRLQTMA